MEKLEDSNDGFCTFVHKYIQMMMKIDCCLQMFMRKQRFSFPCIRDSIEHRTSYELYAFPKAYD